MALDIEHGKGEKKPTIKEENSALPQEPDPQISVQKEKPIEKPLDVVDMSLDSDDSIRAIQIAAREERKRARVSDPGPSRFSLTENTQTPLSSKPLMARRSFSPLRKRIQAGKEDRHKKKRYRWGKSTLHDRFSPFDAARTSKDPMITSIVDRILHCLRNYSDGWIRLDKLETHFGQMYGLSLHEECLEAFGDDQTYIKLKDAGIEEFEMNMGDWGWYLKLKRQISDIPFSEFLRTAEADPMIWSLVEKILHCLRYWDFDEWVPLERLCEFFGPFHGMTLPEACKKLVGPVDTYPKLFAASRDKFIAELRYGQWHLKRIVMSGVPTNKESPEKPSRETLKKYNLDPDRHNESWRHEPWMLKILPSRGYIPITTPFDPRPSPEPRGVDSWGALNVSWSDEPSTSQIPTPIAGPGCPTLFRNPEQVPPPLFSCPAQPPVAAHPMVNPPRTPTIPRFMSDPRLVDFTYRIRHVLCGMYGHSYLPSLEEAYFRSFGSRLQDDFFFIVPSATFDILTQVSHGEIVVSTTYDGLPHFRLQPKSR